MEHPFFVAFVLVSGLALTAAALKWRWQPTLRTSLIVGIGFRLVVLAFAAASSWQPVDFIQGFQEAGRAAQSLQDPVLASEGSWHFLPMIPYFYGILLSTGLPWVIAGRLCTVMADVALIVLVGRLAGPERRAQASFLYACSPIAVMVAALHGQVESIALVFLVGSYLAARSQRVVAAGVLFGLALSAGSWPVILLPVVLSMLPTWQQRVRGLIAAGLVPFFFLLSLPIVVHSSWNDMVHVTKYLGGVRPVVGEWGWTAVMTGGQNILVPGYAKVGQVILYTTLALVAWHWRKADKIDLTSAMLLAFMLVTPRMGSQYLLWFVPFLCARPTRWSNVAMAASALWAGLGYLWLTQYDDNGWWSHHVYWAQGSTLVIPLLALAMPWYRRVTTPTGPEPLPTERPVPVAG